MSFGRRSRETQAFGFVAYIKNDTKQTNSIQNYKILVVRARSGFWGFPKGGKDMQDANGMQTALRELREETGIGEKDIIKIFPEDVNWKCEYILRSGMRKCVTLYCCLLDKDIIQKKQGWKYDSAEIVRHDFVRLNKLCNRFTFPEHLALATAVRAWFEKTMP